MNLQKQQFKKEVYEGDKGRILLQLSKTYKGDSRFQLNQKFKDDIQQEKLPQKFKKIVQNNVLEKIQKIDKTKQITKNKQKPLIIRRFQPGTKNAQKIIQKAQQQIKAIEKQKNKQKIQAQKKLNKKNKAIQIKKGIDKAKKAQLIINNQLKKSQKKSQSTTKYQLKIKGDRKQAFQASQFRLFS